MYVDKVSADVCFAEKSKNTKIGDPKQFSILEKKLFEHRKIKKEK